MAVENVNYCVGLINYSCSLLIYSRKDTCPLNSRLLMNWFPTILGIFIYLFVVSSSVFKKKKYLCLGVIHSAVVHME